MKTKQGEYKKGIWIPNTSHKVAKRGVIGDDNKSVNSPKGNPFDLTSSQEPYDSKREGDRIVNNLLGIKNKEVFERIDNRDLVFKLRRKAREYLGKGKGMLSLASRIENKITNWKEVEYSDKELMEMVE